MLNQSEVLDILREDMLVAFSLAVPMLVVSLAVGLVIAVFQAATQIHEQTLTFVAKLIVIALFLLIGASYMMNTMIDFIRNLFEIMATM